MDYFILVAGWVLYFAVHSILASEGVKKAAEAKLGSSYRFYRLFYSLLSTIGLVGLLFLNGRIESEYFFPREGVIRYLSLLFTTFGVMTIQIAFRQYKLKSFLGFTHEKSELKVEGILTVIRHPIAAGLALITIGFFLFIPNMPTLISCAIVFIYLPIGIYLEEKKLIVAHGEAYQRYKESVPAIFPRIPHGN